MVIEGEPIAKKGKRFWPCEWNEAAKALIGVRELEIRQGTDFYEDFMDLLSSKGFKDLETLSLNVTSVSGRLLGPTTFTSRRPQLHSLRTLKIHEVGVDSGRIYKYLATQKTITNLELTVISTSTKSQERHPLFLPCLVP